MESNRRSDGQTIQAKESALPVALKRGARVAVIGVGLAAASLSIAATPAMAAGSGGVSGSIVNGDGLGCLSVNAVDNEWRYGYRDQCTGGERQKWTYNKDTKQIGLAASSWCLGNSGDSSLKSRTYRCDSGDDSQQWDYNQQTGQIQHVNSNKCLDSRVSSEWRYATLENCAAAGTVPTTQRWQIPGFAKPGQTDGDSTKPKGTHSYSGYVWQENAEKKDCKC